jgi:hypothetical protein
MVLKTSGTYGLLTVKNSQEIAVPKANPARGSRTELAGKIASFMGKEENRITEIPGVSLHRRTAPIHLPVF